MGERKYIDPDRAAMGQAQADLDWSAGTVRTNQDVAMWQDSSYALSYIARIEERAAEHSWRSSPPKSPRAAAAGD